MSLLDELVQQGDAALTEVREARIRQEEERQARLRAELAAYLPDEVWEALGLNPATAFLHVDQNPQGFNQQSGFTVQGTPCTVKLSAQLVQSQHQRFHFAHLSFPYKRTVALGSDRALNQRKVGEALAQHVRDFPLEEQAAYERHLQNQQGWFNLRGHNPLTCKAFINGLREDTILAAEERQRLILRAEEFLAQLIAQDEEREAARETTRTFLRGVAGSAQAFLVEWGEYQEQCQSWVERWTATLWEPHQLVRVTFTTSDVARVLEAAMQEGYDGALPLSDLLLTAYRLPRPADAEGYYATVNPYGGVLERTRFSAVVKEMAVEYDRPSTTQRLENHRSLQVGDYWLNIPAHVSHMPNDEPPAEPSTWHERLVANAAAWVDVLRMLDRVGDRNHPMHHLGVHDWANRPLTDLFPNLFASPTA